MKNIIFGLIAVLLLFLVAALIWGQARQLVTDNKGQLNPLAVSNSLNTLYQREIKKVLPYTNNYLPKWTEGKNLTNSSISDNGDTVSISTLTLTGSCTVYNSFDVINQSGISLFRINRNGYIGNNNSNPLHQASFMCSDSIGGIEIAAQLPTLYFTDINGGEQSGSISFQNGQFSFNNIGDGRLIIEPNGNVGIGGSPNYGLHINTSTYLNGGVRFKYELIGTTTTLSIDSYIICLSGITSGFSVYLPSAVGCSGKIYIFKRDLQFTSAAENIYIIPNGSETIDNQTEYTFNLAGTDIYKRLTIVSDGSNWLILENN